MGKFDRENALSERLKKLKSQQEEARRALVKLNITKKPRETAVIERLPLPISSEVQHRRINSGIIFHDMRENFLFDQESVRQPLPVPHQSKVVKWQSTYRFLAPMILEETYDDAFTYESLYALDRQQLISNHFSDMGRLMSPELEKKPFFTTKTANVYAVSQSLNSTYGNRINLASGPDLTEPLSEPTTGHNTDPAIDTEESRTRESRSSGPPQRRSKTREAKSGTAAPPPAQHGQQLIQPVQPAQPVQSSPKVSDGSTMPSDGAGSHPQPSRASGPGPSGSKETVSGTKNQDTHVLQIEGDSCEAVPQKAFDLPFVGRFRVEAPVDTYVDPAVDNKLIEKYLGVRIVIPSTEQTLQEANFEDRRSQNELTQAGTQLSTSLILISLPSSLRRLSLPAVSLSPIDLFKLSVSLKKLEELEIRNLPAPYTAFKNNTSTSLILEEETCSQICVQSLRRLYLSDAKLTDVELIMKFFPSLEELNLNNPRFVVGLQMRDVVRKLTGALPMHSAVLASDRRGSASSSGLSATASLQGLDLSGISPLYQLKSLEISNCGTCPREYLRNLLFLFSPTLQTLILRGTVLPLPMVYACTPLLFPELRKARLENILYTCIGEEEQEVYAAYFSDDVDISSQRGNASLLLLDVLSMLYVCPKLSSLVISGPCSPSGPEKPITCYRDSLPAGVLFKLLLFLQTHEKASPTSRLTELDVFACSERDIYRFLKMAKASVSFEGMRRICLRNAFPSLTSPQVRPEELAALFPPECSVSTSLTA